MYTGTKKLNTWMADVVMFTLLGWDITDKKGEDRMIHGVIDISINSCLDQYRHQRLHI